MRGKSRKQVKNKEKKLDKMAMALARLTVGMRKVRDNFWHWCSVCQMAYCHDFRGDDAFCHQCPYKGCLKEQGKTEVCQACGNVRKFQ
jgi:hypothetical protein